MGKRVKNIVIPKDKVQNPIKKPEKSVSNIIKSNSQNDRLVSIELTCFPRWTHSVRVGSFTNEFHSEKEAAKHFFFIIDKLLPYLKVNGANIKNRPDHCHLLNGDKRIYAEKIIKEVHDFPIGEDAEIWQLGISQGIRLVASVVIDQVVRIYPLFIDEHHLMYESDDYNDQDFSRKSCKFRPQEKYR